MARPASSARPARPDVAINGGRFLVATSGTAEGPSQALARFLADHDAAEVYLLAHPLLPEEPGEHRLERLVEPVPPRVFRRPNRPPLTFVLDPVTPLRLPAVDAWIGFNCLATAQGLANRRLGRTRRVLHWSVDFVPDRFGPGLLTRVYDGLDRFCIRRADGRVELSDAAFTGRLERYRLDPATCPAEIVPMGSWSQDAPRTSAALLAAPRLVFLGHLVERMGVPLVVELAAELRRRGRRVAVDIVGGGPLLDDVRRKVAAASLADVVTVHGFVEDFDDVRRILAGAVVALAPYDERSDSFSRFADPGKLKAYLGAGLPVLMTGVPPNSAVMQRDAGATVLPSDVDAFADAVLGVLDDPASWTRRHDAALRAAADQYDWNRLLGRALPRLGLALDDSTLTGS